MQIKQLNIDNVRIIQQAQIKTCPNINLFIGENASGKTSILEAISILATTRSFRTDRVSQVISYEKKNLVVRAKIKDDKKVEQQIGVLRTKDGGHKININFTVANRLELANKLSIQVISPKVSDLVFSGSKTRRDFLDWGVFHVEHSNRKNLSKFKKALKQRNTCLRNFKKDSQQIKAWSDILIKMGKKLDQARRKQLLGIVEIFNSNYAKLLNLSGIDFKYYQGWSEGEDLSTALDKTLDRDKNKGTTTAGPHLADIKIISDDHNAKDMLSRGQTKLLSFLLRLSQMQLFIESQNKTPVLLLDDMSAELDLKNRNIIIDCLDRLKIQTFMTATNAHQVELSKDIKHKMFHVKHGKISDHVK